MRSCSDVLARDLTVEVDGIDAGSTVARYYDQSGNVADTPNDATTAAWVFGIPPGVHTVRTHDSTGKTISEEQNVAFQPDAVTVMNWLNPMTSTSQ